MALWTSGSFYHSTDDDELLDTIFLNEFLQHYYDNDDKDAIANLLNLFIDALCWLRAVIVGKKVLGALCIQMMI